MPQPSNNQSKFGTPAVTALVYTSQLISREEVDQRIRKGLEAIFRSRNALEYEINRLASYRNWPSTAPVTPQALSRAGFFYTGNKDIVECFSCHSQIRGFEIGDTAIGVHQKQFPRCPFVMNVPNHGNVPMAEGPDFTAISEPNGATGTQTSNKGTCKKQLLSATKTASNLQTRNEDMLTKANNQVKAIFKSEFKRLLSYQNWPKTCPMDPRDCAKAGFFYTGKEDTVQCFACLGKIGKFKEGDDPLFNHNRQFPSCPYVVGKNVHNQPISEEQLEAAIHFLEDKIPIPDSASLQPRQIQYPRSIPRACHPEFASKQARLESYEGWPSAVAPIQLVWAGFFYTGIGDSCKCFYCGKGLQKWESTDEPWMEHARWFPQCEWLIQQRGMAYVDYVVHNFPPPEVPSANDFPRNHSQKDDDRKGPDIAARRPSLELKHEVELCRYKQLCKVCMDREKNTYFLLCNHMVACEECAQSLQKCPICRDKICYVLKIYKA